MEIWEFYSCKTLSYRYLKNIKKKNGKFGEFKTKIKYLSKKFTDAGQEQVNSKRLDFPVESMKIINDRIEMMITDVTVKKKQTIKHIKTNQKFQICTTRKLFCSE